MPRIPRIIPSPCIVLSGQSGSKVKGFCVNSLGRRRLSAAELLIGGMLFMPLGHGASVAEGPVAQLSGAPWH